MTPIFNAAGIYAPDSLEVELIRASMTKSAETRLALDLIPGVCTFSFSCTYSKENADFQLLLSAMHLSDSQIVQGFAVSDLLEEYHARLVDTCLVQGQALRPYHTWVLIDLRLYDAIALLLDIVVCQKRLLGRFRVGEWCEHSSSIPLEVKERMDFVGTRSARVKSGIENEVVWPLESITSGAMVFPANPLAEASSIPGVVGKPFIVVGSCPIPKY
ncbi:hypothetical protein BCR44DRAFT_399643 [Catenaria anguillulae PL171]|uniref:Uncharacterized protein n=1 Tax=Catenaria anguillulae PL171 TaxID=765915 RepID=A0A1Y2HUX3_9FUNG|nr:hypothetical protein BCR44DRAFT_399643 [Catenaria anguillulae PL171]